MKYEPKNFDLSEDSTPVEPLFTSKRRGTVENRIWAKLIDFFIIQAFLFIFYSLLGSNWMLLLAPIFWTVMDLVNEGQSPGKWLLGLHVVDSLGAPLPKFSNCFIRNLPFLFLSISVFYFDTFLGFSSVILSILLLLLETYFVLLVQSGIRIGDVLSTTKVQDYRDQHMQFIEQYLKEDLD
jgi:uncharacterized RDD family membrane protein YckC